MAEEEFHGSDDASVNHADDRNVFTHLETELEFGHIHFLQQEVEEGKAEGINGQ